MEKGSQPDKPGKKKDSPDSSNPTGKIRKNLDDSANVLRNSFDTVENVKKNKKEISEKLKRIEKNIEQ